MPSLKGYPQGFDSSFKRGNPANGLSHRFAYRLIAIIFSNVYPLPSWATDIAQVTQTETTTSKRLNITVNISEPDDLKVSEGEQIAKGEIIADRERARTRLTARPTETATAIIRPTQSSFYHSTSSTSSSTADDGITTHQLFRTRGSSRKK